MGAWPAARRELHGLRSCVAERAAHLEEGLEQARLVSASVFLVIRRIHMACRTICCMQVKRQREELPGQALPEVEQRTGLQLAALTRQVNLERQSRCASHTSGVSVQ